MHAWLCENPVGVDALTWKELPTPQPGAGEVLIAIKAASLNFPDLLIVQNKYQMKPPLPFVPGSEYAGVVEAVGEGVTQLKVGQNVACLSGTGGFGTHVIAQAAACMPLPTGFSHVDAAAFIMIYATSHHALIDRTMPMAQLKEAYRLCAEHNLYAPTTEQPQYNLFHRTRVEKEYAPLYRDHGLGTTIWSPLASGLLTGKYNAGVPKNSRLDAPGMEWLRDMILKQPGIEKKLAAVPKFAALADELGTTLPRLALAWCLKNPHVSTVILGASRPEQLTENLGALDLVDKLTPAVLKRLETISKPVAD